MKRKFKFDLLPGKYMYKEHSWTYWLKAEVVKTEDPRITLVYIGENPFPAYLHELPTDSVFLPIGKVQS